MFKKCGIVKIDLFDICKGIYFIFVMRIKGDIIVSGLNLFILIKSPSVMLLSLISPKVLRLTSLFIS